MKRTLFPGIYGRLNDLKPHDLLTYDGMRDLFQCESDKTIERTVDRGELPPPIKLFGNHVWLAGTLLNHLEGLAQSVIDERNAAQNKVKRLYPTRKR